MTGKRKTTEVGAAKGSKAKVTRGRKVLNRFDLSAPSSRESPPQREIIKLDDAIKILGELIEKQAREEALDKVKDILENLTKRDILFKCQKEHIIRDIQRLRESK